MNSSSKLEITFFSSSEQSIFQDMSWKFFQNLNAKFRIDSCSACLKLDRKTERNSRSFGWGGVKRRLSTLMAFRGNTFTGNKIEHKLPCTRLIEGRMVIYRYNKPGGTCNLVNQLKLAHLRYNPIQPIDADVNDSVYIRIVHTVTSSHYIYIWSTYIRKRVGKAIVIFWRSDSFRRLREYWSSGRHCGRSSVRMASEKLRRHAAEEVLSKKKKVLTKNKTTEGPTWKIEMIFIIYSFVHFSRRGRLDRLTVNKLRD